MHFYSEIFGKYGINDKIQLNMLILFNYFSAKYFLSGHIWQNFYQFICIVIEYDNNMFTSQPQLDLWFNILLYKNIKI